MRKRETEKMINDKRQMTIGKWFPVPAAYCLLLTLLFAATGQAQSTPPAATPDFQSVIARQASLVSEFEINGLKVLVKRREGSQTVAAGLFIRGGVENISSTN